MPGKRGFPSPSAGWPTEKECFVSSGAAGNAGACVGITGGLLNTLGILREGCFGPESGRV